MNKLFLRKNTASLISLGVLVILFFLVIFAFKSYTAEKEKVDGLATEVSQLNDKVAIIQTNKQKIKENLNEYNKLLKRLIPDKEDFFSILYTLEELSLQTGFTITNYTITLSSSSKEKYSLRIEGTGDSQSFLKFLKEYQFSGGRFVTSEKIEFTPAEEGKIKISVNFYSKKIPTSLEAVAKVSEMDLILMEQIRSKTKLEIKSLETTEDYPTKSNPF